MSTVTLKQDGLLILISSSIFHIHDSHVFLCCFSAIYNYKQNMSNWLAFGKQFCIWKCTVTFITTGYKMCAATCLIFILFADSIGNIPSISIFFIQSRREYQSEHHSPEHHKISHPSAYFYTEQKRVSENIISSASVSLQFCAAPW